MDYTGHIIKMQTTHLSPIKYELMFDEQMVCMNDFIKKYIILKFENEIHCIDCGKKTNKTFKKNNLYLFDSGAQYLDGTTDVTRTISIGDNPTSEQKDIFC